MEAILQVFQKEIQPGSKVTVYTAGQTFEIVFCSMEEGLLIGLLNGHRLTLSAASVIGYLASQEDTVQPVVEVRAAAPVTAEEKAVKYADVETTQFIESIDCTVLGDQMQPDLIWTEMNLISEPSSAISREVNSVMTDLRRYHEPDAQADLNRVSQTIRQMLQQSPERSTLINRLNIYALYLQGRWKEAFYLLDKDVLDGPSIQAARQVLPEELFFSYLGSLVMAYVPEFTGQQQLMIRYYAVECAQRSQVYELLVWLQNLQNQYAEEIEEDSTIQEVLLYLICKRDTAVSVQEVRQKEVRDLLQQAKRLWRPRPVLESEKHRKEAQLKVFLEEIGAECERGQVAAEMVQPELHATELQTEENEPVQPLKEQLEPEDSYYLGVVVDWSEIGQGTHYWLKIPGQMDKENLHLHPMQIADPVLLMKLQSGCIGTKVCFVLRSNDGSRATASHACMEMKSRSEFLNEPHDAPKRTLPSYVALEDHHDEGEEHFARRIAPYLQEQSPEDAKLYAAMADFRLLFESGASRLDGSLFSVAGWNHVLAWKQKAEEAHYLTAELLEELKQALREDGEGKLADILTSMQSALNVDHPLYMPLGKGPISLKDELEEMKSPEQVWSYALDQANAGDYAAVVKAVEKWKELYQERKGRKFRPDNDKRWQRAEILAQCCRACCEDDWAEASAQKDRFSVPPFTEAEMEKLNKLVGSL